MAGRITSGNAPTPARGRIQRNILLESRDVAPVDFSKINIAGKTEAPAPLLGTSKSKPDFTRITGLPKDEPRTFLPDTQVTAGKPDLVQKIVSVLPQPIQRPVEFVLNDIRDGLFGSAESREVLRHMERQGFSPDLPTVLANEGLFPFFGRSDTDKIEHVSSKLESAGTDPARAAAIAFYDVFGRGNPQDPFVELAKERLAELAVTQREENTLTLARIGQIAGSAGDVLNVVPIASISKAARPNLVKMLLKASDEESASAILRGAGVPEDLIGTYGPTFAKTTERATVERGVDNLIKTMETTKPTITPDLKPFAAVAQKETNGSGVYRTLKEFDDSLETARFFGYKNLEDFYAAPEQKGSLKPSAYEALKTQERMFFGETYKGTPNSFFDLVKGKTPIEQSSRGTKDIAQLERMLQRERDSLAAAQANPEAHAKAYGGDRVPQYKAKITELESRIEKARVDMAPEEVASLDSAIQASARPTEDLPWVEPTVSREGQAALEEVSNLRDLRPGMSAAEARARAALREAREQRDMFRDIARDMPGHQLARYESRQRPGTLPEILGKTPKEIKERKLRPGKFNQKGDQILDDALGYKDHGWNSIEDAEKALQDYKSVRAQVREMEETVQRRMKDLKKIQAAGKMAERKSIVDDLVAYVNEQGAERTRKVQAVQDYFKLTNKEMGKILRNERDLRLMDDTQFDAFMKRIEGKATEAFMRARVKAELEATIFEKELVKTDNLRKAVRLPRIHNMTTQQMKDLNELLLTFKQGDEFLGVRQIETVKNTDLAGIRTKREALERLLVDVNKLRGRKGLPPTTMEEMDSIKVNVLDKFRYDIALARRNPLYELMVQEVHRSILNGDMAVQEVRDKIDDLFKAARASRERGLLDRLIPFDTQIFRWLEASDAEKLKLADDMTAEELEAAMYVRDWYAEARDYLVQQKVLKRFIGDYVTHIRRSFLEAWREEGSYLAGQISGEKPGKAKRFGSGLLAAAKELWQQHQLEEATFNILNEKTGEVLPLEKFFQFSMSRTGQIVPSKNVAKAFLKYVETFEKKKMLDSVIPKLDIYVHSLTPKKLTPRGLEFDDSLKRFFKTWMNSKKGRPMDLGFIKPGDRLDWALRMGVAFTRIIDLGLNVPVGIASNLGAQIAVYRGLGEKAYALGQMRLKTKQGGAIVKKYQNLVGRSVYNRVTSAEGTLGESLYAGFLGLFSFADRKARQVFLLGTLTPEEYRAGTVSADRLTDIQMALGRHLPLENMESIVGETSLGRIGTQYRSWAIPLLSSTLDDLSKAWRAMRRRRRSGNLKYLESPEFFELLRTSIVSAAVGLGAYGIITDDTPKNQQSFAEKAAASAARDSLSLIGVLSPEFWTSPARLLSFMNDIGTAITQVLTVDRNQNGELTGVNTLERVLTPAAVRQFLPPKETSKKSGAGLPGLPDLPKLPTLPKLPKIGG